MSTNFSYVLCCNNANGKGFANFIALFTAFNNKKTILVDLLTAQAT